MDIDYALRNMPSDVRVKVRQLVDKYKETNKQEYAEMAIALVKEFDDDYARELKLVLKK